MDCCCSTSVVGARDKCGTWKARQDKGETGGKASASWRLLSCRTGHTITMALATASAGRRRSRPDAVALALAHRVRAMDRYYSNLLEGHAIHAIDIERVLMKDYAAVMTLTRLPLADAKHGVSLEEEARRILEDAAAPRTQEPA